MPVEQRSSDELLDVVRVVASAEFASRVAAAEAAATLPAVLVPALPAPAASSFVSERKLERQVVDWQSAEAFIGGCARWRSS